MIISSGCPIDRDGNLVPGTQGSSSSDRVIISFLRDLARSLASETGARNAALLLQDAHLGCWMASTEDVDTASPPLQFAGLGTALDRARADTHTPCLVGLTDGRNGRLLLLADAPDSVLALLLIEPPAPLADAPNSSLVQEARAALFRSLLVSGMGRAMLTQAALDLAPQPEPSEHGSFENLIGQCASLAATLVGAASAGIMLYDAPTDRMTIAKPAFGIDDESLLRQYCVSLASPANSVRVFKTGEPYVSQDCLTDPRTPRSVLSSLKTFDVHQLLVVPLLGRTRPIGVINVADKKTGGFSEGDVRIVQSMGGVFGRLIDDHLAQDMAARDKAVLVDQLSDKSRQIESLRFHVSLTDALLSCLVSDQSGLDKMMARLSTLLNRHLLIYSPSGKILAQSPRAGESVAASLAPPVFAGIDCAEERTLILREVTDSPGRLQPLPAAAEAPEDVAVGPGCVLLKPLHAGRRALGYLAVCGFDGRLSREEQVATERACTYITAEMMRDLDRRGSEEGRGAALVEALVAGRSGEAELRDVSRGLGRAITPPWGVLVARRLDLTTAAGCPQHERFESPMFHDALDAALGRAWLMSARENECVVICSMEASAGRGVEGGGGPAFLRDRLAAALEKRGGEGPLSVGIGPLCTTPADIPSAYNEARVAAAIAPGTGHESVVVCAEGLGLYRLLAQIGRQEVLLQFAERALGPLLHNDRCKVSRHLETLECYLDCDCHLKQASARLHLHPNTLRYRLGRIQELLGCDVNDSAARLNLAVALKALRLARMLDSDTAAWA